MNICKPFALAAFFACLVLVSGPKASAVTPSFTITATGATISTSTSSGTGASTFTLTSVNGYTGSVRVTCNSPAPVPGVTVPYCTYGGQTSGAAVPVQPPIALTANETATGTMFFYNAPVPCSNPCPVSLPRSGGHRLAQGLALAGAVLFGLGFYRRRARWLTLTMLAIGSLAGIAGISACGSNSVVTPGTYTYSLNAMDISTLVSVNTSIQVTVP